ncbi:hypothetical protein [Herbiconiux sp. UC225_62]|uniref:hypothetical protein n=1 Tax=Herbiconiux sp. UC225_62 TaxID=3350168 RepID=UPI0036D38AF0
MGKDSRTRRKQARWDADTEALAVVRSMRGPSVRTRIVVASVLIAFGVAAFGCTDVLLASPPAAVLSTDKQGDVADVDAGSIEIGSSSLRPLRMEFATEMHLTATTRETYALEIRAPMDGFVECDTDDCAYSPLYLRLAFTGTANGGHYRILTNDFGDDSESMIHASFSSSTGSTATVQETGQAEHPLLQDTRDRAQSATVLELEFARTPFLFRPADVGWTKAAVRVEVTPDQENAAQSGPYFAVQAPAVTTLASSAIYNAASPFSPSTIVFRPIPQMATLFGIIDETGAAILTGGLENEAGWRIKPGSYTSGFGPVVSYVDHRLMQRAEFWRQFWLLVSAAMIGLAFGMLADAIFGGWRRRG